MQNKYIINWELSLNCNLDCDFCSQKKRRFKNKSSLWINEIFKIIDNLPHNSHISFLWWETLIFPNIIKIFEKLEKIWISYEITTNGTLLYEFIDNLIKLKKLIQINISIDWYWSFHDISRQKKWLFKNIINIIPKLLEIKNLNISTIITEKLENKNLLKLYLILNKLWVKEHKLIYLMYFSDSDIKNSKIQINKLKISSPWDYWIKIIKDYKNMFLIKYKKLKNIWLNTKILFEPNNILLKWKTSCKQIDKQYRINEKWNLSICEFLENDFSNLINISLEDAIKNIRYNKFKEKILSHFPLDICKTCCKNYNI